MAEVEDAEYEKTDTGFWIPRLYPKQMEVFNCYKRYVLVEGPKWSSKTYSVLHKICRHLYETDGAEVGCFSKIIKAAKNTGSWQILCEIVVPQWVSAGVLSWVKYPTIDGSTKVNYFVVKNRFGSTSKCSLFSVENDSELEIKVKNTSYTMVYVMELSNFKSRLVFDTTITQLRSFHLKYEDFCWYGDTNPDEDGELSWIFQLFFVERLAESSNPDDKVFRDDLHVISFTLADNLELDPRVVSTLKSAYAHSQDLTDRYVKGLWTASSDSSHFADIFLPNLHVQGEVIGANREEWEVITPTETCYELFLGLDLGDTNHSAHIATKRIVKKDIAFDVIDELVVIKGRISIEDFTLALLEKIKHWEDYIKINFGEDRKILLRCWSDSSAWNFKSAANSQDAIIVRNVSEGKITLHAAEKGAGSVRLRVNLVRRLLFENRLFISAQLGATIAMLRGLKKGKTETHFISPVDPHKHAFDSMSYMLVGESPLDSIEQSRPQLNKSHSTVVTVSM